MKTSTNSEHTEQLFISRNNKLVGGTPVIGTREEWRRYMIIFKDTYDSIIEKDMPKDKLVLIETWIDNILDNDNLVSFDTWIDNILDKELEKVEECCEND
jgi:hypothetical protein